jgi:hypothetical protein
MNNSCRNAKQKMVWGTIAHHLLFFGVSFLLSSCGNGYKETTISVSPEKSTCNAHARIESFIRLESNDSTLIGDITTLEFFQDRIYVFDKKVSKTLFVFDKDGKFLNKVKRGKGPGEIIEPWDFCINRDEKTILLWDQMTFKLNTYDLNLSYLKSEISPRLAIRNMTHLGGGDFLIFSQFYLVEGGKVIERELYDYLTYKDDFESLDRKLIKSNPKTRLVTLINPICKGKENYFIAPGDNHIYQLVDGGARQVLDFDFGKYQITDEDLDKGHRFYRREIRKGNRVGPLGDLFINDDYATVSFKYRGGSEFIIVDRITKKMISSFDLCSDNQLPVCRIKGLKEGNKFVGVVDALTFRNYISSLEGEYRELGNVDAFSNQVLMNFVLEK